MVSIIRHATPPATARNEAPYRPPVMPNLVARTKVRPEPKPKKIAIEPFVVRQIEYIGWGKHEVLRPLDLIAKTVCEVFGISRNDLLSDRRTKYLARPRQAAYLLAREFTTKSFPEIGRYFGGRDHSTIVHGVEATKKREDSEYQALVEKARERLRSALQ